MTQATPAPTLDGFQERLDAASSALLFPMAKYRPISSHGGAMSAQDGLILHVTTNHFDPYGFFSNPNNGASSTWWLSETVVGKCSCPTPQDIVLIEQYYDALMKCWAQMAGNSEYQALETSGTNTSAMSAAMVHTAAHLLAWGHTSRLSWVLGTIETPGAKGFGWHGMGGDAWGGHFGCPGTLRKNQRAEIIKQANAILGHTAPHVLTPTHDVAPRFLGLIASGAHGLAVHEWQAQMKHRGWNIAVDGYFGAKSASVCQQFETILVKHRWEFVDAAGKPHFTTVDGKVGLTTWHAAWDAPNLT